MDDCDFLDNFDKRTKMMCCMVSTVVLAMTALVGLSFGAVEPTQYGILYNLVTKQLDTTTILEGGLQYVGATNQIITFPRIQKSIEFSD
jgi:hypothetical protein